MMSDAKQPEGKAIWRKVAVPAMFGGVFGFGAAFALGSFADGSWVGGLSTSAEIALIGGGLYVLIALMTLLGTLNPKAGARYLNVEDEGELAEMRAVLVNSCAAMALWGAALMALALAAPGPLAAPLALAIALGGLLGGAMFAWRSWKLSDELMAAVTTEANSLTALLAFAVLGGWGMLAHLGYIPGPQPLDLLTGLYALSLLATFVTVARRGMMRLG